MGTHFRIESYGKVSLTYILLLIVEVDNWKLLWASWRHLALFLFELSLHSDPDDTLRKVRPLVRDLFPADLQFAKFTSNLWSRGRQGRQGLGFRKWRFSLVSKMNGEVNTESSIKTDILSSPWVRQNFNHELYWYPEHYRSSSGQVHTLPWWLE